MSELSSETGMRFTKKNFKKGGLRLEWLTDDEQDKLAHWDFYGNDKEEQCEKVLFEIGKLCDGYTVHEYELSNNRWKHLGTTLCSTINTNKERKGISKEIRPMTKEERQRAKEKEQQNDT